MQLGQAEINNFITTMLTARVYVGKGGGGLKPSQILSSGYYVYKQLRQKDVQKLYKRGINSFQAVLHIQKSKLKNVPTHI